MRFKQSDLLDCVNGCWGFYEIQQSAGMTGFLRDGWEGRVRGWQNGWMDGLKNGYIRL